MAALFKKKIQEDYIGNPELDYQIDRNDLSKILEIPVIRKSVFFHLKSACSIYSNEVEAALSKDNRKDSEQDHDTAIPEGECESMFNDPSLLDEQIAYLVTTCNRSQIARDELLFTAYEINRKLDEVETAVSSL